MGSKGHSKFMRWRNWGCNLQLLPFISIKIVDNKKEQQDADGFQPSYGSSSLCYNIEMAKLQGNKAIFSPRAGEHSLCILSGGCTVDAGGVSEVTAGRKGVFFHAERVGYVDAGALLWDWLIFSWFQTVPVGIELSFSGRDATSTRVWRKGTD